MVNHPKVKIYGMAIFYLLNVCGRELESLTKLALSEKSFVLLRYEISFTQLLFTNVGMSQLLEAL